MYSRILIFLLMVASFASPAFGQAKKLADRPGFKDPALFTRMPNFYLSYPDSVVEKQFEGYQFPGKRGNQRVEGHYWYYKYRFDESAGAIPSGLQTVRNYQAAAAKIGGKIMDNFPDGRATTLMIPHEGKEIWAYVLPYYGGKEYHLVVVEREAMRQDVIANADAMKDGLAQNGHVEVSGIYFDFNKADLKPESKPALDELAKLLKANPSLRVWVVGHTDNVGSVESNLALSKARAAAVIAALSTAGIAPARLAPFGNGPYAPVAANTTDDGRAKNRRVELVAQP
jgi:outer membrane protein OmpA-like peptidoglycan-associated protein